MVKPVTVRVTVTDWGLPIDEPLLSTAVMVMVPVYVPGVTFTAAAVTPNELPVPLSVPEAPARVSQELVAEACQVTGRAQVPLSLSPTVSELELVCPCESEKAKGAEVNVESKQGGETVSVTKNVCELPCTVAPLASLAAMVTVVLYVPAISPLIFGMTPILLDSPLPPMVVLGCVSVNQFAWVATEVFQESGHSQPPHAVNMTVCATGLADAPCTALNESALDEGGEMVQGDCTTRLTVMTCGLPGDVLPLVSVPLSMICPT
jgi:hypothetical protein